MVDPAKTQGIGRLLDLCIAALETGDVRDLARKKVATKGPKKGQEIVLWDYEMSGHGGAEPSPRGPRPKGSGNFGVVANLCALIVSGGRDQRAAGWLEAFYRRQGPDGDLGHMLFEPLSHVYGDAHIVSALLTIAAAGRLPQRLAALDAAARFADALLSRELALCLLHRAPGGRIIHAGTRSKAPKAGQRSPARESFVEAALYGVGEKLPEGRVRKAAKLAHWSAPIALHDAGKAWGWRVHPDLLQPHLSEIRFASGPLVVTHFENGHVSRWATGPICYQSPMPANVVQYEPLVVVPFLRAGKGQQGGLRTKLDNGILLSILADHKEDEHLLLNHSEAGVGVDLGAVVTEHRIGGIPL